MIAHNENYSLTKVFDVIIVDASQDAPHILVRCRAGVVKWRLVDERRGPCGGNVIGMPEQSCPLVMQRKYLFP